MQLPEYILFIDTETSGMPKRWSIPTCKLDKWPFILQIAWAIYTRDGEKVAVRNFYIDPGKIAIDQQSQQLHGITHQLLTEKGLKRKKVIKLLSKDLDRYKPLIVGHFLEFDRRMMEVGFSRAKIKQNFNNLPQFCTMKFSNRLRTSSFTPNHLRLDELYQLLFNETLQNHHNAYNDAMATKDCFFELLKQGQITPKIIDFQQKDFQKPSRRKMLLTWLAIAFLFALAAITIFSRLSD